MMWFADSLLRGNDGKPRRMEKEEKKSGAAAGMMAIIPVPGSSAALFLLVCCAKSSFPRKRESDSLFPFPILSYTFLIIEKWYWYCEMRNESAEIPIRRMLDIRRMAIGSPLSFSPPSPALPPPGGRESDIWPSTARKDITAL